MKGFTGYWVSGLFALALITGGCAATGGDVSHAVHGPGSVQRDSYSGAGRNTGKPCCEHPSGSGTTAGSGSPGGSVGF